MQSTVHTLFFSTHRQEATGCIAESRVIVQTTLHRTSVPFSCSVLINNMQQDSPVVSTAVRLYGRLKCRDGCILIVYTLHFKARTSFSIIVLTHVMCNLSTHLPQDAGRAPERVVRGVPGIAHARVLHVGIIGRDACAPTAPQWMYEKTQRAVGHVARF